MPVVAVAALVMLGVGLAIRAAGDPVASGRVLLGALVVTGAPLAWRTLRGMARGQFASDIVAMLAIVGAAALDQPVAGLVVVVMQSGGEALERYAEGRASAAVRALEQDAPHVAHRLGGNGTDLEDIVVDAISVGDMLLVRPGEMIPCDAVVADGRSHVDSSRLTGEPIPVSASPGVALLSGSLNIDGPLVIRATAVAGESQYARIVDLVRTAQSSKAPLQRLADRYAVWFTPLTLAVCAVAWLASGDLQRVLAVLVVATPCPLILATPVAIIGGINRAARELVVVRTGGALERLASVNVAVFDKTGTLTVGSPEVERVTPLGSRDSSELLRLAGSIEQGSGHLLARSVVDAARAVGAVLGRPTSVEEYAGQGVTGQLDGHAILVGSRSLVEAQAPAAMAALGGAPRTAGLRSFIVIDGAAAGIIEYADKLRGGLAPFFARLRALGIGRLVLLSGDSTAHTTAVAAEVGITEVRGDLLPGDKVGAIRELVDSGARVLMVGDGTNDAPALTTADVGIALAGHGGGIVAEAADIVILGSDVTRVADAIVISRRTLQVAKQSIRVGLALSGAAMALAAVGLIAPVPGALLQEAIDVAVIVNALRTSRTGAGTPSRERPDTSSGPSRQTALARESTFRA